MKAHDHQKLTEELDGYANQIDYSVVDIAAIHALSVNLDHRQAETRIIRHRLALQKAQVQVRDAYHAMTHGEDEAASDMLGVAQYWLAKATPAS